MLPRFLLFGITAGFLVGECVMLPVKDFGRLEVVAADIGGNPVRGAKVRFYDSQTSLNVSMDPVGEPFTVVRVPLEVGADAAANPRMAIGKIGPIW